MWSRETLIPGLYSTEWYNGKKIQEGWIANNEDYLVGVPRLRLLRVEEGTPIRLTNLILLFFILTCEKIEIFSPLSNKGNHIVARAGSMIYAREKLRDV